MYIVWSSTAFEFPDTMHMKMEGKDSKKGELDLVQINDAHYVLKFYSTSTADAFVCDIDDIEDVDMTSKMLSINFDGMNKLHYFYIPSQMYMEMFQEAYLYCKHLTDLSLSLHTITRDYYFATVYSAMKNNTEKNILTNNINALVSKPQAFSVVELPQNYQYEDGAARQRQQEMLSTKCIFCQVQKKNAPEMDYFVHPYVPSNRRGGQIAMCDKCLIEWEKHRDLAHQAGELILEGEFNEELCAVCSDTPKTIVMCSSCVRSFCNSCIIQVLSTEELTEMQESEEWRCMLCAQGLLHVNPLPRQRWTKVEFEKAMFSPFRYERATTSIQQLQLIETVKSPETSATNNAQLIHADTIEASDVGAAGETSFGGCSSFTQILQFPTNEESPKKSSRKNKKRRSSVPSPPPVVSTAGEDFFFAKYISDSAKNSFGSKTSKKVDVPAGYTEEVCFLCKDGGDVVECEHTCGGSHCQKVYHEYCLNFKVRHLKRKWICPRHFCDGCAKNTIDLACLYCPLSVCLSCASTTPEVTAGLVNDRSIDTSALGWNETHNVKLIVCSGCIALANKCISNNNIKGHILSSWVAFLSKAVGDNASKDATKKLQRKR